MMSHRRKLLPCSDLLPVRQRVNGQQVFHDKCSMTSENYSYERDLKLTRDILAKCSGSNQESSETMRIVNGTV